MFRMQQLQPMISQLKEKYKHDKQRMGKEQMLLFKKHGANPMSGCLPMLLQLPVFFALFRTLQLSFEMRQAPFLLWVNDLSKPDTLLNLPFTIPFLGNGLNILPLIMTGASFAQMKLMPKVPAADPQAQAQQKMMSFMPIMFAFILYNMPLRTHSLLDYEHYIQHYRESGNSKVLKKDKNQIVRYCATEEIETIIGFFITLCPQ